MTDNKSPINPRVLKWARERTGLRREDVAKALKQTEETIEKWETGISSPTYTQLEKLAYSLYKRPLALFLMPEPPDEQDIQSEMRLVPEFASDDFESDTLLAFREARSMQESLRVLTNGRNPSERRILDAIDVENNTSVNSLADKVRKFIDVSLETQKSWKSASEAFTHWRDAIERAGVFVFKRSMKQRSVSGFCLYDLEYPIIYINNSGTEAINRQIFTLFHELAHLLFSSSGVTVEGADDPSKYTPEIREIEVRCNALAAEILVPENDFKRVTAVDIEIDAIARMYSVSREVVLRRFLDLGRVTKAEYREKVDEWMRFPNNKKSRTGGDYYRTKRQYLSKRFVQIAYTEYYLGRCTLAELGDHLGMKAQTAEKFEVYADFEG